MSSADSSDQPACPVDHKAREAWLQAAQAQAQSQKPPQAQPNSSSSSPLSGTCDSSTVDQSATPSPSIFRPKFASSRLATDRQVSSIPRAATPSTSVDSPNAQTSAPPTSTSGHWIYPSESQFHSALVRKHGAQSAPPEDTMHAVVPIHNAVNERTWTEILGWERLDRVSPNASVKKDGAGPRLVSFSGDSQKLTPRAWWLSILGYTKPFDRHDWIVERQSGERVEYVIDFYSGKQNPQAVKGPVPLSFYLDVRPKLNSWEGIRMRVYRFWGLS